MENKSRPISQGSSSLPYAHLLDHLDTRRGQILKFDSFLMDETDWLKAPASSREDFHLAYPGGLVKHSVGVTKTLLKLRETLAPDLSTESCVIAGLYHDLGIAGLPGQPYYLPNPDQCMFKNRGINYIINKDLVNMDIATRSLFFDIKPCRAISRRGPGNQVSRWTVHSGEQVRCPQRMQAN